MPNQIDYAFISAREGGSATDGYVPASQVSKSGVTIATGFDLGQRNEADLTRLGLSVDLMAKLKPYLGKTGKDATDALSAQRLTISATEAAEIDKAVKAGEVDRLRLGYLAAIDNKSKTDFFALPAEAQTVIASASFQYGDLGARAPKFWKAVSAQDWSEAVKILRAFGDAYPTRRNLEADLLAKVAK
jgi:hypothetical protein